MIKIYIQDYDWVIHFIFEDIEYYLYKLNIQLKDDINYGIVKSNLLENTSLLIINKHNSIFEFIDTLNHEKNHIEMHICEKYNINPLSEEASYLSGLLSKSIIKSLMEYILYEH